MNIVNRTRMKHMHISNVMNYILKRGKRMKHISNAASNSIPEVTMAETRLKCIEFFYSRCDNNL